MNLVVDLGNSRIKAGLFDSKELAVLKVFDDSENFFRWLEDQNPDHVIVSSVTLPADEVLQKVNAGGKKLAMSSTLPLPIVNRYESPQSLGVDRIAAACGAIEKFPQRSCLVIDLGSCINYEFVDESANYLGGAISPGVSMRFKAMHTFTARLPLINPTEFVMLTGSTTEECMQSGVMIGVLSEIEGMIARHMEKYPKMGVILCGGDAHFFENKLKHPIFVAPNLVLVGLNSILLHNVDI